MNLDLPLPAAQLAGCCWLPRIGGKARAYLAGRLPRAYRVAFGSPVGVDGYFLRHFGISRRRFVAGVADSTDEPALAQWFLKQPGVDRAKIDRWNALAPKLGAWGQPGYVTRHLVKWLLYPKSVRRPVRSYFEAIEQDEA